MLKELSKYYTIGEKDKSMKNKEKAVEIARKILTCGKCKSKLNWIEGTNVCVCPNCSVSLNKKSDSKKKNETTVLPIYKTLKNKDVEFLKHNQKWIKEAFANE